MPRLPTAAGIRVGPESMRTNGRASLVPHQRQQSGEQVPEPHLGRTVELSLVVCEQVRKTEVMRTGELARPLLALYWVSRAGKCWRADPGDEDEEKLAGWPTRLPPSTRIMAMS